MYKYIFITYSALYSGNLAMNWILLDYWLLFPICSPLIHSINLLWYDHWEVMTFLLVVWYKDLFQFYTVLEYGACSLKFLEHLIMLNTPPSWPLFSLPCVPILGRIMGFRVSPNSCPVLALPLCDFMTEEAVTSSLVPLSAHPSSRHDITPYLPQFQRVRMKWNNICEQWTLTQSPFFPTTVSVV